MAVIVAVDLPRTSEMAVLAAHRIGGVATVDVGSSVVVMVDDPRIGSVATVDAPRLESSMIIALFKGYIPVDLNAVVMLGHGLRKCKAEQMWPCVMIDCVLY